MLSRPFYVYIATVFGLGFYSSMPGTLGSFAACTLNAFIDIPLWLIFLVTVIGVWTSDLSEKFLGMTDPSCVIIDEVVGMWLSVYLLPKGFLVPGFFLFRLVDILKPFPVSLMEKLPGGWGIMADDIVGGILVNIFLQIIKFYFLR